MVNIYSVAVPALRKMAADYKAAGTDDRNIRIAAMLGDFSYIERDLDRSLICDRAADMPKRDRVAYLASHGFHLTKI